MSKKTKFLSLALALMLMVSLLAGCTAKEDGKEPVANGETVKIEVRGLEHEYDKVPERAFPLGYDAVELLVALGLKDKIVACASSHYAVDECLPEYQKDIADIDCVGIYASFENLLEKNTDLVYGADWYFMAEYLADESDYIDNGIPYYIAQGSYSESATFDDIYADILNLARIFRVEDRADKLIQDMKDRVAEVQKNAVTNSPTVFVYDDGDKQASTVASRSIETQMIELAGGKNIFDDINEKYTNVSWEEVANRNPQWIIINEFQSENLTQTKEEFLKSNPALANCDAVKNDYFISVNLIEVREGLQCVDGLEKMLDGFKSAE